ncbi:MAG: 5-(carboxyamino)imidazole ribonucleotide synthase [Polyangiales bacterium]
MSVIVRPPVLGIFGGGQLARMTTVAAHALGFNVRILDPDPHCPAATVCDELITAAFDDSIAAQRLALGCVAVTVDLENVGLDAMRAAARHAPVRPSPDVLAIVQDRDTQREWLRTHSLPIPEVIAVSTSAELDAALAKVRRPAFVKTTRGGYDGKGQVRVDGDDSQEEAREMVRHVPCVVEQNVAFVAELSVQIARGPEGEVAAFPPAYNHHEHQILSWSMLPAPIEDETKAAAIELATRVAEQLDLVGLLTVELFLLEDGSLLINELAPRPHNSFHSTLHNARSSQFDQVVRAVTGLPLGDTGVLPYIVVANLLGERWNDEGQLDVKEALAVVGVDVTIYGKRVARPARKMGHLTATAASAKGAYAAAAAAMKAMGSPLPKGLLDLSTV